jgi:hypothetical protein
MSVRGTSRHFATMQNVFATGLSKIESETIFVALTPTGNEPWRARQLFTRGSSRNEHNAQDVIVCDGCPPQTQGPKERTQVMSKKILSISAFAALLCFASVSAQAAANIVAAMVVATLTKAWSWCPVRSLLLRSAWFAGQDFVGTLGGTAAGHTESIRIAIERKWVICPTGKSPICLSSPCCKHLSAFQIDDLDRATLTLSA